MLFELIVINTEFQFLGGFYSAGLMICREAQHARMGEEFTAYAPSSTNRIRAAAAPKSEPPQRPWCGLRGRHWPASAVGGQPGGQICRALEVEQGICQGFQLLQR